MVVKLKTRKSAAKRINIKKRVLARKASSLGHLRRKKASKQKRALQAPKQIHFADLSVFKSFVPKLI